MLISGCNINLIVLGKAVHKRIYFASRTLINKLIDEGYGEVILRTDPVDVTIINTDLNNTLFFSHRDNIRDPIHEGNGVDETSLEKLFNFCFNSCSLPRVHRVKTLANRFSARIRGCLMHHDTRINARHLFIGPNKDILKFTK